MFILHVALRYWQYLTLVALLGVMWYKYGSVAWCKLQLANIRRHKILFASIALLLVICYKMFIANYDVQSPITKKGINLMDLVGQAQGELSACTIDLEQAKADKKTAMEANNQDILK